MAEPEDTTIYNVEDYRAIISSLRLYAESLTDAKAYDQVLHKEVIEEAFDVVRDAESKLIMTLHPGLRMQTFKVNTVDPYWVCVACGKSRPMDEIREFLTLECEVQT